MKRMLAFAGILALATIGVFGQASDSSSQASQPMPPPLAPTPMVSPFEVPAFSRMSVGAGLSPLGIGLQVSTDINAHLNLRGIGNFFSYSTNFNTNGIPVTASLTLGTGGAMADYYPFHHGFRLSGGVLFINQNGLSASANIPGGNSFTVNSQTYFSANASTVTGATPLTGSGNLALNSTKPGFLVTTGWGNHVRRNGHLAFPVEIGAAFVGTPKVNLAFAGWVCADPAQTQCYDVAGNSSTAQQFQSNLSAQISKWNSDLNVLQAYPIISIGIAYSWQTKSY